jgi:hypothetical protein
VIAFELGFVGGEEGGGVVLKCLDLVRSETVTVLMRSMYLDGVPVLIVTFVHVDGEAR